MANAPITGGTTGLHGNQYSQCEDFKHQLIQLCEEVCFLRMTKKESEERMRHLVADQHKHERQLEEEILKNSSLKERHEQELADLNRSHQDEIQHLKREKNKLNWENESWEENVKSVKDEVRTLQLEKYNLERMIREQSHCLKTHAAASSSHQKQATEIETNFKEVKQLVERCNTQTSNLSKEVKEAIVLNKRLSFISSHHNCEKRDLETKLEEKEKIICELEIMNKVKEVGPDGSDDAKRRNLQQWQELSLIREQLREMKNNEEILQKQLNQSRERNKEIIGQYEEAQKLVEQYVIGNERHRSNASELELENRKIKEEVERLNEEMKEGRHRETDLKQEINQLKASTSSKEDDYRSEISGLKDENQYLLKTSEILRDKNGSLEKKHTDAIAQMTKLQEELNGRQKSKEDASTMTEAIDINHHYVSEHQPSLSMKHEDVHGEPGSRKYNQQILIENSDMSSSATKLKMNVTNLNIHSGKVQEVDGNSDEAPLSSKVSIHKNDPQSTPETFTEDVSISLNTLKRDEAAKLNDPENDVSSPKVGADNILLVQTTENISHKFEGSEKSSSGSGVENMPTRVIVSEHLNTETDNLGNATVSDIDKAHSHSKRNTGESTPVIEEENTTVNNCPELLPVLTKKTDDTVATAFSPAGVIPKVSSHVKDVEKGKEDGALEINDNEIPDETETNKTTSSPGADGSPEIGVVRRNDERDRFKPSTGLDYANIAYIKHVSNVKIATNASEEVHSLPKKVDKVTFRPSETGTCNESTRESEIPLFENPKDQEKIEIRTTVKEVSNDSNIAKENGNVSYNVKDCSMSVLPKTSFNNYVTSSQKSTREGCSSKTTVLSQPSSSNHTLATTISESFTTNRTSQMVTVSGSVKYDDVRHPVSFKSDDIDLSGSSDLPRDMQIRENKKRQADYIEEDRPAKKHCAECETSKVDAVIATSVSLDDHDSYHIPPATCNPRNVNTQQVIENTPSVTAVTQIKDVQDKVSSVESMASQETSQETPRHEIKPQLLSINTPEKPSTSFVRLNQLSTNLLRPCTTLRNETRSLFVNPVETISSEPHYKTGRSQVGPMSALNVSSLLMPQSQLLPKERFKLPTSSVVDLRNLSMKTDGKSNKDGGLCDMNSSDGGHTGQPLPSIVPICTKEICTVSWSGYKGKGVVTPSSKLSLQSLDGSELRIQGASKDFLSQSKFKVKLHDVLKDFPNTSVQRVQVTEGMWSFPVNERNNIVGETGDGRPLPLEHNFSTKGSGSMYVASQLDDKDEILADNPAVLLMTSDTAKNTKTALPDVEQNASTKQETSGQNSQENLFSDDGGEEDEISTTLSKEIERAQSILNRNRLKRTRRCKEMAD